MNPVNLFLDVFGLALIIFQTILCRWSFSRQRKTSRAYVLLRSTIFAFVLTDLFGWMLEGQVFPGSKTLYTIVLLLYFAIVGCISPFWLIYCDDKLQYNPKKKKPRLILYLIPAALNLITIVLHLCGIPIFTIEEGNKYVRGTLYPVHLILSLICIFVSLILIIRACRGLSPIQRHEYLALSMFLPPILIAYIVQIALYGVSLTPICLSLSAILAFLAEQEYLLHIDQMTGVRNRFAYEPQTVWLLAHVPYNRTLFLLMIDADRFKGINDKFGHSEGDRAVRFIAQALLSACERSDIICRFGGDEFIVSGQRFTEENVKQLVRDIHAAIQDIAGQENLPYRLSVSIGVALFDSNFSGTPDELLRIADTDMYKRKAEKKANERHEKPQA